MKNELRIGNLVNFKDKPRVVYQIRNSGCDFHIADNAFHSYEWGAIKPIPLTEEWLLKFGFQRHDQGSVSAQFSYGTNPVTQDYLIYLKWIKDYENDYHLNGFPFYQNGYFEIKHIHQLQNLYFALTGEELTIK